MPNTSSSQLVSSKRPWVAPDMSALRVEATELGSGYYAEKVGMYGCTFYDANSATNMCVIPST